MLKVTDFYRVFVVAAVLSVSMQNIWSQDTIRFDHGLITDGGGSFRDRSAFTADPVAWLFVTGNAVHPVDGTVSYVTPAPNNTNKPDRGQSEKTIATGSGEAETRESKWQSVTPDKDGYFTGKNQRGGGIYLEYDSPAEKTMLLEAAGNGISIVNGVPLEGDIYNWGFSIRPVRLKKGVNSIYLTMGRFQGVKALLVSPKGPVQLTTKDLTLPDLVSEEEVSRYGAVQVINSSSREMRGYSLKCVINGNSETTLLPVLTHENTRKLPFMLPVQGDISGNEATALLILLSPAGKEIDKIEFKLKNKHFIETHDRTFISSIDGSVQYYSVTPGGTGESGEALFLSVHGAGVEARGQARAYKSKEWGNLVAATNRRPYGFNWEDWGRMDAVEVLAEAKRLFNPDPSRIYLTGHSMGGHGTWHLGALYPSYFAAIAPSAGYPDLLNYGFRSVVSSQIPASEMMMRANNPSRTALLVRNYLHFGVYVFHGDSDETVPVEQAREMRKLLGTFHTDFSYYEYPGGHHWISDESVDWPPIFEYFKRHTIPADNELLKIEFHTANPGISASSHWLTISQQTIPLRLSSAVIIIDTAKNLVNCTTDNVTLLSLSSRNMAVKAPFDIFIDSVPVKAAGSADNGMIWLEKKNGQWSLSKELGPMMKNPAQNGPFKEAFNNRMVFVYGTGGTKVENEWMYFRARYDASTFGYRGNGSVEIIRDKVFDADIYKGRNIIIYGNINTNSAWNQVLENCPVETGNGYIRIGEKQFTGEDLACFFTYPRSGDNKALVGVVSATGLMGLRGTFTNQYLNSGNGFPDVTIVNSDGPVKGYESVLGTGFFGNNWKVESGEFYWK